MQAKNRKFETDCFQFLSPDILQLCYVMLLADWQQKMTFYSLNTENNGIFHVYMTTSVSADDIIQIKLNDYSSRY